MAQVFYRGFSTANWLKNKSFTLTNIDLVKQDLLNHIYTIKGERVMMPNFGTRIPVMAFEQNDAITRAIIEEDLTAVFNYDKRVKLLSLNILSLPANNAIIALADLLYIEFNVTGVLRIEVPTQ
jgi:phage baseplate assembly protein W